MGIFEMDLSEMETSQSKASEKKKKRGTIVLVLLLCNCLLIASALALAGVFELKDRKDGIEFYEEARTESTPVPTVEALETPAPVPTEEPHGWAALDTSGKDFEAMRAEWPDIKAWIRIEGTKVDYPVVQGDNNKFYLNHLPDGKRNSGGSIMMDMANTDDFTDAVTILHGHHMKSGSMFGDLDLYEEEAYYKEHPVIELYTPKGDVQAEIFAVFYVSSVTFDYPTNFADDAAYNAFLEMCCAESMYDTGIRPTTDDTLLMLSTCSYVYDEARLLVLARLDLP